MEWSRTYDTIYTIYIHTHRGKYGREERPPEEINLKVRVIVTKGPEAVEKQINGLRAEEIRNAELTFILMLQKERYSDSFESLSSGEKLHPRAKLRKLRPIWNARDRVMGGRANGAGDSRKKAEPPILFPSNNHVVYLLVTATHRCL